MFFYSMLNDNPNLFKGLVDKIDVTRIAKIIGLDDDPYALSRISFELNLGGNDNDDGQPPIFCEMYDVLEDNMRIEARDTSLEEKLNKAVDSLQQVHEVFNDKRVRSLIRMQERLTDTEINLISKNIIDYKNIVKNSLYDKNRHPYFKTKAKYEYYGRFIISVVSFYTELTGKNIEVGKIIKNEGMSFVSEFNSILNKAAVEVGLKEYEEKTLITACNKAKAALK